MRKIKYLLIALLLSASASAQLNRAQMIDSINRLCGDTILVDSFPFFSAQSKAFIYPDTNALNKLMNEIALSYLNIVTDMTDSLGGATDSVITFDTVTGHYKRRPQAAGPTGATGATGATGPAPSGTGFVRVTGGVIDTPAELSGDLSTSLFTATLNTVNGNVGTFGSATKSIVATVNAKGLITAMSELTITPAVGSITGLGTGVATALAVNVGSAGAFVVNGGALGTPSSGTLTNATGLPEGGLSLTDITTANVSNSAHGFFPKLVANRTYYVDNSGVLTALALGTAGKVLTTNGATSAPTWETPAATSLTVGTTAIGSGTTTRILYDNAGVLGEYTLTGTGTVVAMQTAPTFVTSIETPVVIGGTTTTSTLTLKPTSASGITGADIIFQANNSAEVFRLASGTNHVALLTAGTLLDTKNALRITATQPTTITATQNAIDFQITSAGSSAQNNNGLNVNYLAGFTGTNRITAAGFFANAVAGAHGSSASYSAGVIGTSSGGNYLFGVRGEATASATRAVGVGGYSVTNGAGLNNIGVLGVASNISGSATNIGGYFLIGTALNQGQQLNSALVADNGSSTANIFDAKDNGTTKISIVDDGNLTFADAVNIVTNGTTGTKIGTATSQKLAFFNSTPIIQPVATTDLGTVLSNLGLRAAGTAYPITTSGAVTLTGTTQITSPTFVTGVAADASGFKHVRVTTGSVGAGSTALVTITWVTAFADANYTCVAQVLEATTSSLSMSVVHIESITASAVTVRVLNNALGALTGTLNLIAVHD